MEGKERERTVQISAGTRMMIEREQNQVYPTVRRTQRGTSGPAKYLRVKITIPTVNGSEIRQNTHISLSLYQSESEDDPIAANVFSYGSPPDTALFCFFFSMLRVMRKTIRNYFNLLLFTFFLTFAIFNNGVIHTLKL